MNNISRKHGLNSRLCVIFSRHMHASENDMIQSESVRGLNPKITSVPHNPIKRTIFFHLGPPPTSHRSAELFQLRCRPISSLRDSVRGSQWFSGPVEPDFTAWINYSRRCPRIFFSSVRDRHGWKSRFEGRAGMLLFSVRAVQENRIFRLFTHRSREEGCFAHLAREAKSEAWEVARWIYATAWGCVVNV